MNLKKFHFVIVTLLLICLSGCGLNSNNTTNTSKTNAEKTEEVIPTEIDINEHITMKKDTDEIDFCIKEICWEDIVESKDDNMFRSVYSDVDGERYFVIKTDIKNIGGDTVTSDFIGKVNVQFSSKYNYQLRAVDIYSCVLTQYWSCQPLKTVEVYFLASIPDELVGESYTATFDLAGAFDKNHILYEIKR